MKRAIRYGKRCEKIAEGIYGASSIVYTTLAEKKLKEIEKLGIAHFPVCIAKTQYSFSSDPKAYGVAKDFELKVRDIIINNGAGDDRSGHGRNHADAGSSERAAGPPHRHRKRTDRRIERFCGVR